MLPIAGRPILTAAETRGAEAATGENPWALMELAGAGLAEAIRRLAAGAPVLVLCGPGNNGGDGYVIARLLAAAGLNVKVAASAAPSTPLAKQAARGWSERVIFPAEATPAPVLIDALFGTGLKRALDAKLAQHLARLAEGARLRIAVDLPSGIEADTGALLGPVPRFDITLATGAVKPAHLLQPAAQRCGVVRLIELGLATPGTAKVIGRPDLPAPDTASHKFTRGMVAIVAGPMPGAAALASEAALRAGAGYVLLLGDAGSAGLPNAVVTRPWVADAFADQRIGAVLVGPGLGRSAAAGQRLDMALASRHPLVIDGDALHLLAENDRLDRLARRRGTAVLTPHAGEFEALFGPPAGGKLAATRAAAARIGAIVVNKGPDTVIAGRNGLAQLAPAPSSWLSTAGSGDVLAGTIAAILAAGGEPMHAAAAGVWLHGEAARRCGASFVADDLARALTAARASL